MHTYLAFAPLVGVLSTGCGLAAIAHRYRGREGVTVVVLVVCLLLALVQLIPAKRVTYNYTVNGKTPHATHTPNAVNG